MESVSEKMDRLKTSAEADFIRGNTEDELYQTKVKYLGKKGSLTEILKGLGQLPADQRPSIGAMANEIRAKLETAYLRRSQEIKDLKIAESLKEEALDLTLPGFSYSLGHLHPVSQIMSEMKEIFRRMGFDIFEGPEIETDTYNFEALNIPQDHPARDLQDTFYLDAAFGKTGEPLLLRTHTSPVQIHVMKKEKPPIRMVAPGTVYRRDSDVSHTPMFHQIEGLLVDKGVRLSHLKGVIELFLRHVFSKNIGVRFRPSYFPFTEPSAEVDIECVFCKLGTVSPGTPSLGTALEGCRICKGSGWLEIMGCGMVDPSVFKHVNINSEKYTGFAFGIGIERVAMLKFGINDIRLFFENDMEFLKQF